ASGELERLASSVARYAERAVVLSQLEAGNPDQLACKRIGAPLLFGRLWEETGCRAVVKALLAERLFEFAVERAVFAIVLHRLMVCGSDRACEKWLADYAVPDVDGLALHHLYRAMTWLGEELAADQQAGATPFAARTVKDLIEEQLFAHRRDLFSECCGDCNSPRMCELKFPQGDATAWPTGRAAAGAQDILLAWRMDAGGSTWGTRDDSGTSS
ncbi:MAG: hypothetical protein RQ966_20600, partial [Acetobacteraceae bacterium]|nr:hypothetical protein [Acetobacteraceae bacterium]